MALCTVAAASLCLADPWAQDYNCECDLVRTILLITATVLTFVFVLGFCMGAGCVSWRWSAASSKERSSSSPTPSATPSRKAPGGSRPKTPAASTGPRLRWLRAVSSVRRLLHYRRVWAAYGRYLQHSAVQDLFAGLERRHGRLQRVTTGGVRKGRTASPGLGHSGSQIPGFPVPLAQPCRRRGTA